MNVWWLVLLAVTVVLVSILVFRLHAFLTLLMAGLLVAALTGGEALRGFADRQVETGKLSPAAAEALVRAPAASRLASEFGDTAGKIGILIALASIIGGCLMESRGATTIVDAMLRATGERRAPEGLAASSFLLGIPVFFDTVFYLMVPLARSLRRRVGRNYVLYLMAILAGGSIAHSLVPPTPGPLQVAEIIGVEIGTMLVAGLAIGGCTSVLSLGAARLLNRWVDVPLRESEFGDVGDEGDVGDQGDAAGGAAPAAGRPPLLLALLPIVVPVGLISAASILDSLIDAGVIGEATVPGWLFSLGDKNIALGIGCGFAFTLFRYCPAPKRATLVTRSLASAGNIILITAAGGAFGAMLRQAGIAEAVSSLTRDVPGLLLLPVAFLVTAAIRTLQGSATVAMITAAGVLQGFVEALPFHPVYLAMAIGAGSKPVSWMTDSAFWVITKMSGMTESEGLKVISPMSTAMGCSALAVTMAFAALFPFRP